MPWIKTKGARWVFARWPSQVGTLPFGELSGIEATWHEPLPGVSCWACGPSDVTYSAVRREERLRRGRGVGTLPSSQAPLLSLCCLSTAAYLTTTVPSLCRKRPWRSKYLDPLSHTHFKHLTPSPFLALVPARLCPAKPFVFPCVCRSLSHSHNWSALAS